MDEIDSIPQEILLDFQNRTVLEVTNLSWADAAHSQLVADVLFQELEAMGPVPFSTSDNADTRHGQEVWDKALAGDYGPIAEFIPPTIEEIRQGMPALSARQLRLGLLSLGKLTAVPTAIAALPEPAKSEAEIEWEFASEFHRMHPLIVQLIPILGLTDEQVDEVWMEYATV